MKFKRLNEKVSAKRFSGNAKSFSSARYDIDLDFNTFAEEEGATKALEDIEKVFGYVLDGKYTLRNAISVLMNFQKGKTYDLERAEKSKGERAEYKQDYANGYLKVMDSVLYDLEIF